VTADPPVRQDSGGHDHDDPGGPAAGRRASAGVRFLDALAGLLAAGILVVGVVLLLALLVAPAALAAAGLGPADGPGWGGVVAHLVVGGAGEVVVRRRERWPVPAVLAADLVVVLAVAGVIWWAWLP